MPRVHRITDTNTAGGAIVSTSPNTTVFANSLLVAINGSTGTNDSSCSNNNIHCSGNWVTAGGCSTVFAHGVPINYAGNVDTCGHARQENASPDVFICGFSGGGTMIDNNPPYLGEPCGASLDPVNAVPSGGQSSCTTGYNNTLADVAIYDDNLDDPDGTIGPAPPLTSVKPNVRQVANDQTPAPTNPAPTQDCSTVDALPASFNWINEVGSPTGTFDDWAATFALSTNFTVADVTTRTAVSFYEFTTSVTQASGLTQKEILQNLCYLAKTVLEPFLTSYGSFTITSGFRNKSGTSQHNKGQAVDIQFVSFHGSSTTGDQYFARAQDIRDNQDYDQMILEWFGRNPWIHISTNSAGHRNNVLTQVSRTSYKPGLIQLR